MKKIIGSFLVAGALLVTNAQARDFGDIYIECGLGGIIGNAIEGSTGDVIAIITNVTWDLGTTAISSNITSDSTCVNTRAKTAALIHQGYDKLEEEIAQGHGKYLDALAQISQKDKATFTKELRKKFAEVASSDKYESMSRFEKSEALFNIVTQ